jgi:RimJ/RimL family protein N-acetyltransferase
MTPQISLRRTTADDAEQVAAWRAEPAARVFQPLTQHSIPQLRSILAQRRSRQLGPAADGKFQWIVETPDGDAGWVTITVLNREYGIGALGYTITAPLHRRGYASAAVREILPISFSEAALNLFRVEAIAAVDNLASRRVLEANGFQFDGILPRLLRINEVMVDHARYSLNRPQWFDQRTQQTVTDIHVQIEEEIAH